MIVSQVVITQFGQQSPSGDGSYIPVTEQPVVLKADGLVDGELLKVEYSLIGADVWIPFSPRGAQIVISKDRNPIVLKVPGRYRVVQVTPGPTAATIQTIQATLSHDFLWSLTDPVIAPRGLKGDPGISGGGGGSGSTWRVGSTTPSDALGIDGDLFLNSLTGDFYVKTGGAYLLQGSLRGSDGANGINGTNGAPGDQGLPGTPGSPGTVWRSGIGVIGDGIGINGDFYLNTANGDVYERQLGGYTLVGNIKGLAGSTGAIGPVGPAGTNGVNGAPGTPGTVWRNAAGVPSDALGVNGDYYLNSTNGDYYLKIAGAYVLQGNLAGPGSGATVTSVALSAPTEFIVAGSPVTTNGTLALTKANQSPGLVWAGPVSGPPGQPSFRALVASDISGLTQSIFPAAPAASGKYVGPAIQQTGTPGNGSLSTFQSSINYIPFVAPSDFSATAIRIDISVAGSSFILGLYNSDGAQSFYPGTRLVESTVFSAQPIGIAEYTFLTSIPIARGRVYWLAMSVNNVTISGATLSDGSTLNLGLTPAGGGVVNGVAPGRILRVSGPNVATPQALPAISTANESTRIALAQVPFLLLRAA